MTEQHPYDAGPGAVCDDCGHFAVRHVSGPCSGVLHPCSCTGFAWLDKRYENPSDKASVGI